LFLLALSVAGTVRAQRIVTYAPTTEDFPNPERGFYSHREVQAEGGLLTSNDLQVNVREKSQSLIMRMYYLKKFRSTDLSAAQLNLMAADFTTMRAAGVKCILRFAYSSAETEADAPLSVVERHIDQMSSLVAANADVIAVLQAGFIGAWGEWYYSTNGLNTTANRRAVLLKELQSFPRTMSIQVRTPNYKKDIFTLTQPLTLAEAYSGTNVARTAHHNDCFLASPDDWGTYQDTLVDKLYLSQDTRFTAMGGETCSPSAFSTCATALQEMARMHWSFLNNDYNATVLDSWVSGGCMDDARRRLGYRFELLAGAFTDSVKPGGSFSLSLALMNRGWAAPFNARRVEVMLRSLSDPHVYFVLLPDDPRFWFPGDTIRVSAFIGVPASIPKGKYQVCLNLPDPSPSIRYRPEYSIRLANAGLWQPTTGYNSLQDTLAISGAAAGTPSADTLTFGLLATTTSVPAGSPLMPQSLTLLPSYPNPFNGATRLSYVLRRCDYVSLKVYDLLGREMTTLVAMAEEAGPHEVYFNAGALASSVYMYQLRTGGSALTGGMLLIR
jgi:hypothetical protein